VVNPTFESLVALLGAAGLAIGFAFRDYLSSLIAGIVTIYERPYRPGDWISVDGTYGEVLSVGLRALRMVTPDDTVVIIPHQVLWTSSIHNANDGKRDLMCVTDFFLHPNHDAKLARQLLREVALTSPFLNLERPVAVVLAEKPWGTHYRLKAYPMDSRDQFQFTSDLTVRGKQILAAIGAQAVLVPAMVDISS
jgi:small-conductance mechanosensitive channel